MYNEFLPYLTRSTILETFLYAVMCASRVLFTARLSTLIGKQVRGNLIAFLMKVVMTDKLVLDHGLAGLTRRVASVRIQAFVSFQRTKSFTRLPALDFAVMSFITALVTNQWALMTTG
jgi:hypothetical protein